MSKYISCEKAIRDICEWATNVFDPKFLVREDAIAILENMPAADVREVVLCKDCEFYMQSNFVDDHMECVRFNHPTAPDNFCSHGVKVGEEQT